MNNQETLFAQAAGGENAAPPPPLPAIEGKSGFKPLPSASQACLRPRCQVTFKPRAGKLYCSRRCKCAHANQRLLEQRNHALGHLIRLVKTSEQVNRTALLFAEHIREGGHDPREARTEEEKS
jgi:hypothetical protein